MMNYTKGNIEPTADDCINQAKKTLKWQQFENSGRDSSGRIVLRIPEKDANKYLSAPDMYEALKEADNLIKLARQFFPKSIHNPDKFQLENICATISKAIAKAEGK